jgi:hypothetical protein
MMQSDIINIDAYLKGHLTADEVVVIQQRIAEDADFRAQVIEQRRELLALEILVENDLRTQLSVWETHVATKNRRKTRFYYIFYTLIGLIVVTVGMYLWEKKQAIVTNNKESESARIDTTQNGAFPMQKDTIRKDMIQKDTAQKTSKTPKPIAHTLPSVRKNKNDARKLLTFDMQTDENDLLVVVENLTDQNLRNETENKFAEIKQLIRQKQYKKARLLAQNWQNTEGVFLTACTHFFEKNYRQALLGFDTLVRNQGFNQAETAEFFAALSCIGLNQDTEARRRLTLITSDNEHSYAKNAAIRLQQLTMK